MNRSILLAFGVVKKAGCSSEKDSSCLGPAESQTRQPESEQRSSTEIFHFGLGGKCNKERGENLAARGASLLSFARC
jgi:hypothetical protein